MPTRHFDWILHHARTEPDGVAIIDLASGRRSTFAAMNDRVARLAGYLRAVRGVRKGDRVAALAHNCAELFELIFACARLGAVYLPLNWRLTASEFVYILRDAEARLLVTDVDFSVAGEALRGEGVVADVLRFDPAESWSREDVLEAALPLLEPEVMFHDDIQMLMYTSGTTGFPKAALITYGMTFWNAVNVGIPTRITRTTRMLSVMPMFHTGGLNLFANPVFHAGGTVVMMRGFDAAAMLAALGDRDLAISHTFAVPTAYQAMAQHPSFATTKLDRLEIACVGGAATPRTVLEQWLARGIALANGYGMTETSPAVTLLCPKDAVRKLGSVGQPLLHTEVRVVRADGRDAAVDEPGELWVRGPNVTPGYWRNPEATAAAIRNGWLRTGDVVRRDGEGFCYVIDRVKDMYISGGENVYPAEVEAVLTAIEGVVEAAVIGIPDERWGETGLAVVAVEPGCGPDEAAILARCAARLAHYKLPRRLVLVDRLPRTVTGKIHKPTLRERYAPGGSAC